MPFEREYRALDGSGNNVQSPELGTAGSRLMRIGEARYLEDGSSIDDGDLPNPREVSKAIMTQGGDLNTQNANGVTNLLTFWGQFLDHDLSFTLDNGAPLNIPVPEGDSLGVPEILFNRGEIDPGTGTGPDNPRQQLTSVTSFIDASVVYGSSADINAAVRDEGGKLKVSDGEHLPLNDGTVQKLPADPETSFVAGDLRVNENPALSSLHTIFVREHNHLVDELAANNPDWDAETLYQEAKVINEALIQHVTYDEFLPLLLGENALPDYTGYDPDVDPSISALFSTAAFRVGHTLLPPTLSLLDESGNPTGEGKIALRDAFFLPASELTNNFMGSLLRGMTTDKAQKVDSMVVDDVRQFLVGEGSGALGFDLTALNLQRGRDLGIPLFNDAREALGLERYDDFADITDNPELQANLASVYDSVDEVEAFVGGISEDHAEGAMMGEFFHNVIQDQFLRTRDGDRFYYESRLDEDTVEQVKETSLAEIIERNTGVGDLPDYAFLGVDSVQHTDSEMLIS